MHSKRRLLELAERGEALDDNLYTTPGRYGGGGAGTTWLAGSAVRPTGINDSLWSSHRSHRERLRADRATRQQSLQGFPTVSGALPRIYLIRDRASGTAVTRGLLGAATGSAAGADLVHHRLHDDLSRFKRLIEDTGIGQRRRGIYDSRGLQAGARSLDPQGPWLNFGPGPIRRPPQQRSRRRRLARRTRC